MSFLDTSTFGRKFSIAVSLCMWAIVLYFIIKLSTEYYDSGRYDKSSVTQTSFPTIPLPYTALFGEVGLYCEWRPVGCEYVPFRKQAVSLDEEDCKDIFDDASFDFVGVRYSMILMNASRFRSSFQSQVDRVTFSFALVEKDNMPASLRTLQPTYIQNYRAVGDVLSCNASTDAGNIATLLPVSDTRLVSKIVSGRASIQDFGSPIYIAKNNYASIAFKLSQEKFTDGTIQNTSLFNAMQFGIPADLRIPNVTAVEVALGPETFTVSRVTHTKGVTLITLLGSIFGWVGVFPGASVQALILLVYGLIESRRLTRKSEEDALLCDETSRVQNLEEEVKELRVLVGDMRTLHAVPPSPGPVVGGPTFTGKSPMQVGTVEMVKGRDGPGERGYTPPVDLKNPMHPVAVEAPRPKFSSPQTDFVHKQTL